MKEETLKRNRFAENLKAKRCSKTLKQGDFAKLLETSQVVICRYERGEREPSLDDLCRICDILGVTPNDLLGYYAPPRASLATPQITTHGDNSPVTLNGNITQNFAPKTPSQRRN